MKLDKKGEHGMKGIILKMNNLKLKLILSFSIILIVPAVLVGLFSYSTAKDAVKNEMRDGFKQTINVVSSSINNTIQPKIHDMNLLSQDITSKDYEGEDSPELRPHLAEYAELHPEVDSIFVGTTSGLMIQEPQGDFPADFDPREGDWYKEAMEKQGEVIISAPFLTRDTKEMVVVIAKATKDGSGVVAVTLRLEYLQSMVSEVKVGEEGYATLLDENRIFVSHPTREAGEKAVEDFFDQIYANKSGNFGYVFNGQERFMAFATNELTGWKILGSVATSEISDAAAPILSKLTWVLVIAFVIGAVLVFVIIRSIIKPIVDLKEKAMTISSGDLTETIHVKSNDEIGQLGQAFHQMQQSLKNLVQEVDQNAQQVAASAEELTASAEQTSAATAQVATAVQEVAGSSEKQTEGIDKNVESLEEISEGINRIAVSSTKVSELAHHTTIKAEEGGKAVTNTVSQMNSIHDSVSETNDLIKSLYERSKEVSSILDVITGIADQTNLLALNAAIEAARAGEHGKGFAVVADEVRKLAEQSQQSAKEIFEIVQGIQKDTENTVQIMVRVTDDVQAGVEISNDAIEKFHQILQSTKEITPQMEEVSATSQQMSASLQEVASTGSELVMLAKGNAATSEEVAASTEEQLASMEEIASSAQSLSTMAENLNVLISKFKF